MSGGENTKAGTTAVCQNCGKEFRRKASAQKYCCRDCANRRGLEDGKGTKATCPICGKEFKRKIVHQKFCGKTCAGKSVAERAKENRAAKSKQAKTRTCKYCCKELEASAGWHQFCSDACKKAGAQAAYDAWRQRQPEKVCLICGKTYHQRNNGQLYCGPECRVKAGYEQRLKKQEEMGEDWNVGKAIRLRVIRPIGVYPELMPKVGKIYDGVCKGQTLIIPEIGRHGLIVYQDEVEILED